MNAIHEIGRYDMFGPGRESGQWAAVFLIAGFVAFTIGAVLWKPHEYQSDLPAAFAAFHRDSRRMRWIHSWMIAGTVLGVMGMSAFRELEVWSGETLWSSMGVALWLMGAVLWIVVLVWRMTVVQDAAARTVKSGSVPDGATAQHAWAGWIFWLHLMLQYLATILFGLSVVVAGSLPEWAGWLGAGQGAFLFLGNAARIGVFQPPILVHLWPLVVGIVILVNL